MHHCCLGATAHPLFACLGLEDAPDIEMTSSPTVADVADAADPVHPSASGCLVPSRLSTALSWVTTAVDLCRSLSVSIFKQILLSLIRVKYSIVWHVSRGSIASTEQSEPGANTTLDTGPAMELLRSHLLSSLEQQEHANGDRQSIVGQHGIPNDQLVLVYSLELNAFNKSKLFRCEKYNRVRFHLAPSLFGRNVALFTNYCEDFTQFDR